MNPLSPQVQVGETFSMYRDRRKMINEAVETWLRGRLFWDSAKKGTYFKDPESDKAKRNAARRKFKFLEAYKSVGEVVAA